MTDKLVVIFKHCAQVSPDDWAMLMETLEVNEETKIGDIIKWIDTKRRSEKHVRFEIQTLEKP